MQPRFIFRDFKLPIARQKGRWPIFFDFTRQDLNKECSSEQFITEVSSSASDLIDGVILPPNRLETISRMSAKEIWVRADFDAIYTSNQFSRDEFSLSISDIRHLIQNNISGILGTLILGNPAGFEADNIQNLFSLRSLSLEVGLPLVIDLQVLHSDEADPGFSEIIDLGLNMAVEIGCNLAILPDGGYLDNDENIEKIACMPVLVSLPIQNWFDEDHGWDDRKHRINCIDGIVFTDLQSWSNLSQSQFSDRSMHL